VSYVQVQMNVLNVIVVLSWILSIRHALKRDAHQADSDYLTQIPVLARMEPIDQAINASAVSLIANTVQITSHAGNVLQVCWTRRKVSVFLVNSNTVSNVLQFVFNVWQAIF
jgi:hypothetical protein